jgi:hypothetical protein
MLLSEQLEFVAVKLTLIVSGFGWSSDKKFSPKSSGDSNALSLNKSS